MGRGGVFQFLIPSYRVDGGVRAYLKTGGVKAYFIKIMQKIKPQQKNIEYTYSFKSKYALLLYNIRMRSSMRGVLSFSYFSYIRIGRGGRIVNFLFLDTGAAQPN